MEQERKELLNNESEDRAKNKTGLVLEGGGMRASYTAAVANILLENEIYFDNVYGLSAGSSNTVNYISRDIDRTKRSFVDLVDDPEFGGVDTLIKGKGFFSAEHIYQKAGLPGGYLPFDWDTFVANPPRRPSSRSTAILARPCTGRKTTCPRSRT